MQKSKADFKKVELISAGLNVMYDAKGKYSLVVNSKQTQRWS
jgi:hypothetical protein